MSANQQVAPTYILPNQLGNYFVTPGGGGGTTVTSYYLGENGDFIQLYYQPTIGSPVLVNQENIATTTTVYNLTQLTKYQTIGANITNFAGALTATGTITGSNLALTGAGGGNTITNARSIQLVSPTATSVLTVANDGANTYLTLDGIDPVSYWYKSYVPQTAPGIGIRGTANNVVGLLTSPDGVNLSFAGNVLTSANLANWANYPAINDVTIGTSAIAQHNLYVNNFAHSATDGFYSVVLNATTTIGQASISNAPDVSIYPRYFTVGSTAYPARSITLASGVGGTTINSLQGVSINGATDVNMNAVGVASIEGTAGVIVTSPVSVDIAGLLATITTATTQVTSGVTDFTNATSFSVLSPLTTITGAEASFIPTATANVGSLVTNLYGTTNLNIASPLTTITGAVTTNQAVLNNFLGANIAENLTGYHTTNAMTYITQQVGSGTIRTNIDMYPDYLTLANIKGAKLDLRTDANLTADTGNVLVSALGNGNVNVTAVGNGNITIGTGGTGNLILTNPTATTYRATNIKPATIDGSLTIGNIGGTTDSITLNNVTAINSVNGATFHNIAYITNATLGMGIGSDNGTVTVKSTNNELDLNGHTLVMGGTASADLTAPLFTVHGDETVTGNFTANTLTVDGITDIGDMNVTGNLNVAGAIRVTGGTVVTGSTVFDVPVTFNDSVTQYAPTKDSQWESRTFTITTHPTSGLGTTINNGLKTDTLSVTNGATVVGSATIDNLHVYQASGTGNGNLTVDDVATFNGSIIQNAPTQALAINSAYATVNTVGDIAFTTSDTGNTNITLDNHAGTGNIYCHAGAGNINLTSDSGHINLVAYPTSGTPAVSIINGLGLDNFKATGTGQVLSGLTVTGGITTDAMTNTGNLVVSGREDITGGLSVGGLTQLNNGVNVTFGANILGGATMDTATVTSGLTVTGGTTMDTAIVGTETFNTLNGATGSSVINLQHIGRTVVTPYGTNQFEVQFAYDPSASYYVYTPNTVSTSAPFSYTIRPSIYATPPMTSWGDMAFKYYDGGTTNFVFNFDSGANTITYGDAHTTYATALRLTDTVTIIVQDPLTGLHYLAINGTTVASFTVTSVFISPLGFKAQATQGTYLIDFSAITPGFIGGINNLVQINNNLIQLNNNEASIDKVSIRTQLTGGGFLPIIVYQTITVPLTGSGFGYFQGSAYSAIVDSHGTRFNADRYVAMPSMVSWKYFDTGTVAGVEGKLFIDTDNNLALTVTATGSGGGSTTNYMPVRWYVALFPNQFMTYDSGVP